MYYCITLPYAAHGGCSWGAKGYFGNTGFSSIPVAPDKYIISDEYADYLIEVAVHEFLHVIDDMYEISGDSSFYNPDEMEKWTNYTRPYDYYKWILRNWPTEKWFTLEYGFNVQVREGKYLVNISSTISLQENRTINIQGNITPPVPGLKIRLYISLDNETWLLLQETNISQGGNFEFNIKLLVFGIIRLKLTVPETEKVAYMEKELHPIYIKSQQEVRLTELIESLENQLKSAEIKIVELEDKYDRLAKDYEALKINYRELEKSYEEIKEKCVPIETRDIENIIERQRLIIFILSALVTILIIVITFLLIRVKIRK
ncbi:MAG: hypothetical protein DRP08_05075 [Candidatus Aenigmatarchaeota archaeon]|nr:MAG: hypothetical protein DRP08_05075 [Candidatus Aenigmarchaeota archaeon]